MTGTIKKTSKAKIKATATKTESAIKKAPIAKKVPEAETKNVSISKTESKVTSVGMDNVKKVSDPNVIKKKEIYNHVATSTGLRKRDVREAVDCMLTYMNSCLADGKDIQAPPLGKIRSITRGEGVNSKLIYKLNLKTEKNVEKDSLS